MNRFVVKRSEGQLECPDRYLSHDEYASINVEGVSFRVIRLKDPAKDKDVGTAFDPCAQQLLESCHRFYQPPLVVAGLDVRKSYHRQSSRRQQCSISQVMTDFETATRFWLRHQERFVLAPIIEDTGDIELPKGYWVWVLGYHDEERSIWDGPKAFVINTSGFMNPIRPDFLGIPREELMERFAETPAYWTASGRVLEPDFCPQSLK